MNKWIFNVKANAQEIISKLNSALESADSFVFNSQDDKNDSVSFDMHRRVKYPDQILHRNRVIVNGKINQSESKNESTVEITFSQHLFMRLTLFSIVASGLGLIVIISKMNITTSMQYTLAGLLIVVAIILWLALQKKFARDIEKYKTFISGILE